MHSNLPVEILKVSLNAAVMLIKPSGNHLALDFEFTVYIDDPYKNNNTKKSVDYVCFQCL